MEKSKYFYNRVSLEKYEVYDSTKISKIYNFV